jgi:hypothetical protein
MLLGHVGNSPVQAPWVCYHAKSRPDYVLLVQQHRLRTVCFSCATYMYCTTFCTAGRNLCSCLSQRVFANHRLCHRAM